jgi:2,3-bisphosphoglycerate-dependent phosphoglycerate mutase
MSEKGLKIYLFRHGQSEYNRDHRFTGWHDAKLTNKGKRHAKKIARKLKKKRIDVAIHTSLSRSIDTLKPVLDYHPECHLIFEDDRMIERSYGILEGTTHEEFIEKIGNQQYELRVHGDAFENIRDKRLVRKIKRFLGEREYNAIHRGYKVKVPKGESFYDVELRVKEFIKDLKVMMKKYNVNVAISAHGNSIRLFRKIMEKSTVKKMQGWFIPYDKVFEYSI